MSEDKSFWTTIPGILTATAGIIGAVATLVTALYSAGVIGRHSLSDQAASQASTSAVQSESKPPNATEKGTDAGSTTSASTPALVRLAKTSFQFPGDGEKNNNRKIGPFCCTGETAVIRTSQGTPVGYIYFYDFEDAIMLSSTRSATAKLKILVSGAANQQDDAPQIQESLVFLAANAPKGTKRSTEAGMIRFAATLEDVNVDRTSGMRFDMGSIVVKIDVEAITQ